MKVRKYHIGRNKEMITDIKQENFHIVGEVWLDEYITDLLDLSEVEAELDEELLKLKQKMMSFIISRMN